MKRIIIFLIATILAVAIYGQDTRKTVAVIPAEGESVSREIKNGITNGLEEGVHNSGQYRLLARGEAFAKALTEMHFQQSGAVADNQLIRFGNALGANYVCYASVDKYSEQFYRISFRLIDVALSEIINVGSETVRDGVAGLLTATDNIAKKLFGGSGTSSQQQGGTSSGSGGTKGNGAAYNPDGIDLVYVEGSGSGIMATPGFYIGKFEVTQAQWQAIMGNNPSNFKGSNLPVENVSWNDAQEFISRLNARTGRNYRLPTEAEWEFAARGGTAASFCPGGCEYSGSNSIHSVAWFEGNSGSRTQPVGTKQPNELGIYDMSGNVMEWCEDWYDSRRSYRVVRGGSWSYDAADARVSYRLYDPADRDYDNGFRMACSSE